MTPAETRNSEDQLPSPAVETQAREISLIPETQETMTSSHTETHESLTPVEDESANVISPYLHLPQTQITDGVILMAKFLPVH